MSVQEHALSHTEPKDCTTMIVALIACLVIIWFATFITSDPGCGTSA